MPSFLDDVVTVENENVDIPLPEVVGGGDTAEFKNVIVKNALAPTEYKDAFQVIWDLAKLDPQDFRLDEESVRFKVWQVAMKQKASDGTITPVITTLYAYSGKFRRVTDFDRQTEDAIARMSDRLRERRMTVRRTLGTGLGDPCTQTVLLADWQFGKPETRQGDAGETGPEQTALRIERAVDGVKKQFKDYRRTGRNVRGVALGFMGDAIEHIANSYDSQTFGVRLNLTEQILLALDYMQMACEELLPLGETQQVFGVLCNHGQLGRQGTKTNITDDSDNAQNFLLRLLRDKVVGPKFRDAEWHVPGAEMVTTLDIAGVPVAAAHGHTITGGEDRWLLSQTTTMHALRGVAPRLWLTAHKHSMNVLDLGAVTRIQAATADGGSKHFVDRTGIYSTPGTVALLVGNHDERGFSNVDLL